MISSDSPSAVEESLKSHVRIQAGIIEEMISDSLEGLDEEGIDEAVDEEVEKVLSEITSAIPIVPSTALPKVNINHFIVFLNLLND